MEFETYADVIDSYNLDNQGYSTLTDYIKGNNIKKTTGHLQKASDMGGTNSTPPLATTKLLAIKIG